MHAKRSGGEQGIARAGLRGPLQAFPHGERIASAFGSYAPVGAKAAIGGPAAPAVRGLNAGAYAFGNRAAFPRYPSLEIAAHEAAHIAAAQRGVTVPGGVGSPGDRHERVADEAARAVTAGRSAEPVFEAAYGDTPVQLDGAPQLQMYNRIVSPPPPKSDTPWKQIDDQLALDKSAYNIDVVVGNQSTGFGGMVTTLGDNCYRAESVTASLDGTRQGAERKGDPTQTAYGNIGNFMSWVTNTPTPKGEYFEGGHLVSDEILGTLSYVQYNFAPQRSSLNSPHYRQIETLAAVGPVDKTTNKKAPNWDYDVTLTYDRPHVDVPTATVQTQLGIKDTDITRSPKPSNVRLTTWVPHLWEASLRAGPGKVFSGVSSVDTAKKSGVAKGFLKSESDVRSKAEPLLGAPDTTTFFDVVHWSMDTIKFGVPGGPKSAFNTGTGLDRQQVHTWTGVQSPPRGQTKKKGSGPPSIPAPVAPSVPILSRAFSFQQGWLDTSVTPHVPITKQPAKEAWGKRNKRLASEMQGFAGVPAKRARPTEESFDLLRDEISTALQTAKKPKISRQSLLERSKKAAGKADQRRKRTEMMQILLANLSTDTASYFTS